MKKKSRLRIQKQKKGRRVLLYLLAFVLLGGAVQQLEKQYDLRSSIVETWETFRGASTTSDPVRGTIYDRGRKQLATTLERVSVYARAREINSIEKSVAELSKILPLDIEQVERQLESGVLRLWLAKDISEEQEIAIKELQLPGVYLQRDDQRYYPNEMMAAHLIGSVENGIGLSGVEFYYDRFLANRKLQQQQENQPPSEGLDLVLTVDLKIQAILEAIVRDIGTSEQAEKVAAYLLESGTGELIGGAHQPGFNPNFYARYSREETGNIFLAPLCLPAKFRIFLRDAAMLHGVGVDRLSAPAWSLVRDNNDLGNQLRLWHWLGLEDPPDVDFHVKPPVGEELGRRQQIVTEPDTYLGFVPPTATPLGLLRTLSVLLNQGLQIHPFVVKKIVERKTKEESLLPTREGVGEQLVNWSAVAGERMVSLFRSQAQRGPAKSYFFRDDVLVRVDHGDHRELLINELVFVTLPAGINELDMLVVVQRKPSGVEKKKKKKNGKGIKSLEQIVGEKLERISVLQQVARSLADEFEAEEKDSGNYQGDKALDSGPEKIKRVPVEKIYATGVMPELRGLSLRKSLRLLQGSNLQLDIQGTGKVIDQKPSPGTPLKGIEKCLLILEKQEQLAPEKFTRGEQ